MNKQRINDKKAESDGYVALPKAIELARQRWDWWPETSIRDAVNLGDIPCIRASLRPRAKIFVRMEDLEAHVAKLTEGATTTNEQ